MTSNSKSRLERPLKCIACGHGITLGTSRQHKNYHRSCWNRLFKRNYNKLKNFEVNQH